MRVTVSVPHPYEALSLALGDFCLLSGDWESETGEGRGLDASLSSPPPTRNQPENSSSKSELASRCQVEMYPTGVALRLYVSPLCDALIKKNLVNSAGTENRLVSNTRLPNITPPPAVPFLL